MSQTVANYRWSAENFIRAWEAGAFDERVELIEGEIWPVVIGGWHGRALMRVARRLPEKDFEITNSTLPTGDSLPDPDCWVLRSGAQPVRPLGKRLNQWKSVDVVLVIEVSDDTFVADLNIKARLYGSAGYAVYWVVTQDLIYEHTEPYNSGYANVRTYRAGDQIPVRYAGVALPVDDLLTFD